LNQRKLEKAKKKKYPSARTKPACDTHKKKIKVPRVVGTFFYTKKNNWERRGHPHKSRRNQDKKNKRNRKRTIGKLEDQ